MRHQCFAVCAPGLEPFVAQELVGLGIRRSHVITGGVTFDATSRQLYAANVWLRTATRVLVRIGRFRARDFAQLELGSAAIDWDYWVPPPTRPHLPSVERPIAALSHRRDRATTATRPRSRGRCR